MNTYVDVMDLGRVVKVVGLTKDGKRNICRVYFQEKGSKSSPQFAGITEIPAALFGSGNEGKFSAVYRLGFLPEYLVRQQEAQEQEMLEEDDDYED